MKSDTEPENQSLTKFLSNNDGNILVYGDIVIDEFKKTTTNRLSSEHPIPVFEDLPETIKSLGGAGNVFMNILSFNQKCSILTILEEKYGKMVNQPENVINMEDEDYKNIKKTRYYCQNKQTVRIDSVNNYSMKETVIEKFKRKIDEIISDYNVIIISDYNTGIVHSEITQYLINAANKLDIKTIVDPKNTYNQYKNCTIIKSNRKDAEKFSKRTIENEEDAYFACEMFMKELNADECIITLSENGCVYMNKKKEKVAVDAIIDNTYDIKDVTGAGDTFISTFAMGILRNMKIYDNLYLCNLFCSDVIKRNYVTPVDMLDILKQSNNVFYEADCHLLKPFLKNKKVVFTTGCFDILHEGHIETFKVGKGLGNIFIVALNDDNSIRMLKGNNRPINNLHTRLTILSSIKYIDFIIIFSGETPNEIFNLLEPNILVKGDDYSFEKIKEIFPNVKEFISIPRVNNIDTTSIINKIKNQN